MGPCHHLYLRAVGRFRSVSFLALRQMSIIAVVDGTPPKVLAVRDVVEVVAVVVAVESCKIRIRW